MVRTPPGSLPEGAAERSEAEGVYFDERKWSKLQSLRAPASKPLARRNHRTTLPQSRFRSTAPSEREPGTVAGVRAIQPGTRKTVRLRAIFIAPTVLRRSAQMSSGFDWVSSPGGLGNQRIRTISKRHCPAALPPNTKKTGGGSRLSLQVIFRTGRKSCRFRPRRCARQRGPWADRAWS